MFLWPSITYQPTKLVHVMVGAKVWNDAGGLRPGEKLDVVYTPAPLKAKPAAVAAEAVVPSNPVVTIQPAPGKS